MKILYPLLLILSFHTFAQFNVLESPKSLQLFPRNNANQAEVVVRGQIASTVVKKMSMVVKKDNDFFKYHSQIVPTNATFPLDYNFATTIIALPQEYSFKLYYHYTNTDSIEVMSRERIVCGDIYVLYGQSNIVALSGIDVANNETDDRLLRNFDFGTDYEFNTLQWFPAKQPYAHVGVFGLKLQKTILAQTGIPTCVINGAVGGLPLYALNARDANNPTNLSSFYGRLLTRVQQAGAVGKIKSIIWRQGENEACSWYVELNNYPGNFTTLYNNMVQDFSGFDFFYNIQITIYPCSFGGVVNGAGAIREFQRKTKYIYPKIKTSNCMDVERTDPYHHTKNGYEQIATELYQQISHDIYHTPDSTEITPPDIQKIIKKASNDTLILVFNEDQKITFPNDTTINGTFWQLKNFFYLNQSNSLIQNVWANGNRVFIKLSDIIDAGWLTYLPSRHDPVYVGTHLKNSKGLRAFSFQDFPVAFQLTTRPSIDSIAKISDNALRVYYATPPAGMEIRIERKKNQEINYQYLGTTINNYFDDPITLAGVDSVKYRITLLSATSESEFSSPKRYVPYNCNSITLAGQTTQSTIYTGQHIVSTQQVANQTQYHFVDYTDLLPNFSTSSGVFFQVVKTGCGN